MEKDIKVLPVLPVRGLPVFPYMIVSFDVGREKSVKAMERAVAENQTIFMVAQKNPADEKVTNENVYEIGVVGKVKQLLRLPENEIRVLVEGVKRAEFIRFTENEEYIEAEVIEKDSVSDENDEEERIATEAVMRKLKTQVGDYFAESGKVHSEAVSSLVGVKDADRFCDIVGANVPFQLEDKQAILSEFVVIDRLYLLMELMNKEMQILQIERKISKKVRKTIDKSQKDYYLREQIKAIQDELGDKDSTAQEVEDYLEQLNEANVPENVMKKAEKELSKLRKMHAGNPEASVIRNYIETLIEIPWSKETEEIIDLERAEKILDDEHYGLEKVKERILEFLAIRKLSPDIKSPILCLVGPPGVGKTSIARSIAEAVGRNYVRISLGGVRDEADIRGHRKTYIGAMPGRIINALKNAGSKNPLILLDEIDKMGADFKGDPSAALLEVLDAEQNNAFRDHFVELPFDLSKVMFVATANTLDTIDRTLLDRMEIINLSGYTADEKIHIASRHLFPKQLKNHGLKKSNVKISDEIFGVIVEKYTKEAGVRNLERQIANMLRKIAKMIVAENKKSVSVSNRNIEKLLGRAKFKPSEMNDKNIVGVATGLAWTPFGGDTLFIEVNSMKGSGNLELTGSLGDVMKESAKAAISYIRGNATELGIDADFYKNTDIHIHVPEGATPKDGPSAGITIATALVSSLTKVPVKRDVAMTGEITLRGRVLPIGGLKEKALAAYGAGIRTIIIPSENIKDLDDIDKNIRDEINFVAVDTVEKVLKTALQK